MRKGGRSVLCVKNKFGLTVRVQIPGMHGNICSVDAGLQLRRNSEVDGLGMDTKSQWYALAALRMRPVTKSMSS